MTFYLQAIPHGDSGPEPASVQTVHTYESAFIVLERMLGDYPVGTHRVRVVNSLWCSGDDRTALRMMARAARIDLDLV
jgi:hypothetical protein